MNISKFNSVDSNEVETKWDHIYSNNSFSEPAKVLVDNNFLLPGQGYALDLACGLGANALYLAEAGLNTSAWDASSVALNILEQGAKQKNLELSIKQVFIESNKLPKNTFDVIVVSRFLDRSLCRAIIDSLKLDGLLFYQTYVREKLSPIGPKNPDFLLGRNELLKLFYSLTTVVYREHSLVGNVECGERNEALYIGQKC
jgi:2-polyprenyl-3-methyl-5-hydroxy-6-metoxy-1,4-benzoquinol methylase